MELTTEQRNEMVLQVRHLLRRAVNQYCHRHSILDNDKEDILSAVLLQALHWADGYDAAKGEWTTYACRNAEYFCTNAWKRYVRRRAVDMPFDADGQPVEIPFRMPPEAPQMALEASERLNRAMDRLGDQQKTVVKMRFFDGMTLQQIGDALGLTRERARQIEGDALNNLRRIIKD